MPAIELTAYRLAPLGIGSGLLEFDLALEEGEMVAVDADDPEDARLLLRALATLIPPTAGRFRLAGAEVDFTDYRRLLPVKRQIGYVAADAAMLSNRTLRQNILTMRHYFENSLSIELDAAMAELCRKLGIEKELDLLPAQVDPTDLHRAIAARELGKAPRLMLFDRPEETIGRKGFRRLLEATVDIRGRGAQSWVCASRDLRFLERFCTRNIRIRKGSVTAGRPVSKNFDTSADRSR